MIYTNRLYISLMVDIHAFKYRYTFSCIRSLIKPLQLNQIVQRFLNLIKFKRGVFDICTQGVSLAYMSQPCIHVTQYTVFANLNIHIHIPV